MQREAHIDTRLLAARNLPGAHYESFIDKRRSALAPVVVTPWDSGGVAVGGSGRAQVSGQC
jgi:hypothetical protein